jgi:hypothetical protein
VEKVDCSRRAGEVCNGNQLSIKSIEYE